ncbi:hypothetical protein, partial [Mycobacterium sp.]|uniref:hypothetical protein n=1 Tax=Mycobacterium sp. TaxID=1785 RepID=UPI003BB04E7C
MAGRRGCKWSRGSRQAAARRRGVGLGASACAFLAFGLAPLASTPPAHADVLDVVVDPILNPLQQALAGVGDAVSLIDPTAGLDAVAGLDPAAMLSGLDFGVVVDPAAVLSGVDVA